MTTVKTPMNEQLVSARQLSEALNVDIRTLSRWRKSGWLPFIEFPTGTYRYSLAEVEKLIDERRSSYSQHSVK
ncbi:MAG: hypothetical protein NTZ48_00215 [Candidatus Omnitrophica bacterium]|nr:hypothetical protein [Candidatus Omnitrophota bacterium]